MKKIISISILSLLLILITNNIAKAQNYVPDEVLIKFKRGVGKQVRQVAINLVQGKMVGTFRLDPDLFHLKVPATIGTDIAISNFMRNPNVQYAVRNHIYYLTQDQIFPNDPRFNRQWALHKRGGGKADPDIDAPEAWNIFPGSSNIIVAVLDSGVDYNHEDLAANIWTNSDEIAGNGIDDDGNGYVDDVHGYDFVNNDGDPMDVRGHGTACAGVIGAVGNNGLGITGINWNVSIMCLKIHNDQGISTAADVIEATYYAIENGAHITSNSYGNREDKASEAVREAIERANLAGLLCVFACGNQGVDTDITPFYPACHDNENIISVTATDKNDKQHYSWGRETVDMAGCSPQITTTRPGNEYTSMFNGTSAACPHVAGVAALVWGYEPIGHMGVKNRLMSTVRPVPSLIGMCVTEGTVNAYNALSGGGPPPQLPAAPTDLTAIAVVACDQIDLEWTDNSDNENGFKIERSEDGVNFTQIDTVGANVNTYHNTGLAENNQYWYQVKAYNVGGDSAYSNVVTYITPFCPGEPPAVPTDLAAKARGKNKIALKWKDNSNNENRFYIYRDDNVISSVGPNTTSYVDNNVSSNTTYYYKVCAHNDYGENCSNTASATTK